jgi:biotin carboxyl carrier protein
MNVTEFRFKEAAAFFSLFARAPWTSCHVRTGELEIFVARDRGVANPMAGEAPVPVVEPTTTLRAPHLGTVVGLAEVGTVLTAGQAYAQFELLGETLDLVAESGGRIVAHLLAIGSLAEYDQPLMHLS